MEHEQIHLDPVQREAIKAYKESKDRFKFDIKEMVKNQRDYKAARKPGVIVTKIGEVSPSHAQSLHAINRRDLRHWYIAYAEFRGTYGGYTKFPEKVFPETVNRKYIDEIKQKYVPKTVYSG